MKPPLTFMRLREFAKEIQGKCLLRTLIFRQSETFFSINQGVPKGQYTWPAACRFVSLRLRRHQGERRFSSTSSAAWNNNCQLQYLNHTDLHYFKHDLTTFHFMSFIYHYRYVNAPLVMLRCRQRTAR